MSITLPGRGGGGAPAQRAGRLPDAGDVPQVRMAGDPGVQVPAGAFDNGGAAMVQAGAQMEQTGLRLQAARDRIQARQDAVESAGWESAYADAAQGEFLNLKTTADFADHDTLDGFGKFLNDQKATALASYKGTDAGKMALEVRLETQRGQMARMGGAESAAAGERRVLGVIGTDINRYSDAAYQDPTQLPQLFQSFNARMHDMAPALTPESETAYTSIGQRQIALQAINSHLNRGDDQGAREVMAAVPGIDGILKPEDRDKLNQSFAQIEQARTKGQREGQQAVSQFVAVNGRQPTAAERLQLSHISNTTEGPKTAAQKIADMESVVGKLSPTQRMGVLGIPTVGGTDTNVAEMRKEFVNQSETFKSVKMNYDRMGTVADDGSGDLALIYSFMKILDPGSSVMEGETANAKNTANVPDQVRTLYNRAVGGDGAGFLSPGQRAQFKAQGKSLYETAVTSQTMMEHAYGQLATTSGYDPKKVVLDFVGLPTIGDDRAYDALPPGTAFRGADGIVRKKP